MIQAEDVLSEPALRRVVRVDMLARRVLDSPVYRRFFAAAPGLPELMVLGKIMVLEEARASRFSSSSAVRPAAFLSEGTRTAA